MYVRGGGGDAATVLAYIVRHHRLMLERGDGAAPGRQLVPFTALVRHLSRFVSFIIRLTGRTTATTCLRQLFLLLLFALAAVALVVDARENENVQQEEETADGDGHRQRGGVALIVAGGELSEQVVVGVLVGGRHDDGVVGRTFGGGGLKSGVRFGRRWCCGGRSGGHDTCRCWGRRRRYHMH